MIKKFLINKIAKRLGVSSNSMDYLHALNKVGRHLDLGMPKPLLALGAKNTLRGLLNRFVIPINPDWVWPFWAEQQFNPESKSFVPKGFQIACLNMSQRNWTAIGAIDSELESIVDQRGLIVPLIDGWSLDIWVYKDNKLYAPSKLKNVKQYLRQNMPIVITEFFVDDIKINNEVFIDKINEQDIIFNKVSFVNLGKNSENISLLYSIRPYNVEGVSLINEISYHKNKFFVNKQFSLFLQEKPSQVFCNNYEEGDVANIFSKEDKQKDLAKCQYGLCTGLAKYDFTIDIKQEKNYYAFVPLNVTADLDFASLDYDKILTNCLKAWLNKINTRSIQLKVPDPLLQAAFQANLAYLLLFFDGDSITPGPFTYHMFWYRDAAYMLNALAKMGFVAEAQKVLETYPKKQVGLGHFCSQKGEWDSNGQAIWTMAEHYFLTKDKSFLNKVYPSIKKAAIWIDKNLIKHKDPLFNGLHKQGISAEHFGAHDYYYWDAFWSLSGVISAKKLALVLNKNKDYQYFEKIENRLAKSLDISLAEVAKKLEKAIIPTSPNPSRRLDSAMIGSLCVWYPLQIFAKDDLRLLNTIKYLEDNWLFNNSFFHSIAHSGFGTYLNAHLAQCFLALKNKRALKILDWLLEKATDTYTWPEAINPHGFGGNMGDGHHGWAIADFLLLVRNLLFYEEKDNLVFFSVVPQDWFLKGFSLKNAISHFGNISFEIPIHTNLEKITMKSNFDFSIQPKNIEINLPQETKLLILNDKDYQVKNGLVNLKEV